MRAQEPDIAGHVDRDGVSLGYEVFGSGHARAGPTVLLMPTWTIVHARVWKMQVPYLARHFQVVVYDGPGNGRSGRTNDPERYTFDAYGADAAAVLDACDVQRVIAVGLSLGVPYGLRLAAARPDLVAGLVLVGAALPLAVLDERAPISDSFHDPAPTTPSGWDRYNLAYWHARYDDFATWFFEQVFSEPHSTKAHEDSVGWAGEAGPAVLGASSAHAPLTAAQAYRLLDDVACPMLFVHGTDDRVQGHAVSARAAEHTGAPLVSLVGAGHLPNVRDPVRFNRMLHEFVARVA